MNSWYSWHNLLFLLPVVIGALMAVGAVLGGSDAADDADLEAELEADAEGQGAHVSVLELLGVGKVSLSMLVMLWLLLFGALGLSLQTALANFGRDLASLLAVLGALPGALLSAALLARLLGRYLPGTETYAEGKDALIGLSGTAELDVTREFGMVNVIDAGGALHKLRCRTWDGRLNKGSELLIVDYDPDSDFYIVEESPIVSSGGRQASWY